MKEIITAIEEMQKKLAEIGEFLNIEQMKQKILELEDIMSESGFWNDSDNARKISQEVARLKENIEKYKRLQSEMGDMVLVAREANREHEHEMEKDLAEQLESIRNEFEQFELVTYLSEKYDTKDVILTFHAGAGGVDAQDWAEMLLQMYIKLAEKRGWKSEIIYISRGEEAGIKSATIEISGSYVYGYLQHESGVHRLVRLSPYDADHARHTSFAYVEVLPVMDLPEVDFDESDIRMDVFRSSGPGGQSVNTTDSAVRLTHEPTGITVSMQSEKSQHQNKAQAMKILLSRVQKYTDAEVEEERQRLRGELTEASWGNQIRSYVLHPYKMVKDHRTKYEESDTESVLGGNLDNFLEANLRKQNI